jgi:hypothetical protein
MYNFQPHLSFCIDIVFIYLCFNRWIFKYLLLTAGAWGSVVVKALRYQSDGPGIDSRWCHWIFQWHISFRLYHGPGVDSAPSKNEYQEHFLGVKAAVAWGWQPHHLRVPSVVEIWEPKPPGTLWATPGLLPDSYYSQLMFVGFCKLITICVKNCARKCVRIAKTCRRLYFGMI